MRQSGFLIVIVGVIVLVVGLALPSTAETQTVCACRTIEVPTGRVIPSVLQLPLIGMGFLLVAVGAIAAVWPSRVVVNTATNYG